MRRQLIIGSILLSGCLGSASGNVEIGMVSADTYVPQNLKMSDDDGDDVVSLEVNVTEIDARVNGNWSPISTTRETIDLMKLDHTAFTSLGVTKLPTGKVDKLHIKLDPVGDFVVFKSGHKKPLEIPEDGDIDVTGKLDLDSCMTGIVIVDFDPGVKREDEGGNTEWELKPRARIKTEEVSGKCGPDAGGGGGSDGGTGSCTGVICPTGEVCVNGGCVSDPCTGVLCPPGEMCVNGSCVANNRCTGVTCPAGEICSNGLCISASTPDMGHSCHK